MRCTAQNVPTVRLDLCSYHTVAYVGIEREGQPINKGVVCNNQHIADQITAHTT